MSARDMKTSLSHSRHQPSSFRNMYTRHNLCVRKVVTHSLPRCKWYKSYLIPLVYFICMSCGPTFGFIIRVRTHPLFFRLVSMETILHHRLLFHTRLRPNTDFHSFPFSFSRSSMISLHGDTFYVFVYISFV